jgi:hypothetical protein
MGSDTHAFSPAGTPGDVATFNKLGWEVYNQHWVPNNGNNCPRNQKP